MKKFLFLLLITFIYNIRAIASVGDTTFVQANIAKLSWYGNYDTVAVFPTTTATYRKIYMVFTLGKYACAPGTTYCGDWDYTVTNYLITPSGQQYEISRLITPYANSGAPRTPLTWKQHYVYDVTDYAPLLKDSATIRINYSGYSGGFTANIKFVFIEGIPDRNVTGIEKLWSGYFAYGDTTHHDSNSINAHLPTKIIGAPTSTAYQELKVTVSGHGSDANNCNEFCAHSYYVYHNLHKVDSYLVWRDNCPMNELFPQSGTWLYQRANWCPGAMVYSEHHKLPFSETGPYSTVGLKFDPYVSNGGAGYGIEGQVFSYGAFNKSLDASMEQIIAPTRNENYFRENPICGNPIIHVKNTGSTTIDSLTVGYLITTAGTPMQYTWTGVLHSLEETDITLPQMPQFNQISGLHDTTIFKAYIINVNGIQDNDRSNDSMHSQFIAGPNWPTQFKIALKTNNETITGSTTISGASWVIYDMNNTIIRSRQNVNINSLYTDTINLSAGCYRLVLTDSGCIGYQWWADSYSGITAGYCMAMKMNNFALPMNGYSYSGTYNNDFGCSFTQNFTVGNFTNGIAEVNETPSLFVYPNPAQNVVMVELTGVSTVSGKILMHDALGRVVLEKICIDAHLELSIGDLSNGIYTVTYITDNGDKKLTARLVKMK